MFPKRVRPTFRYARFSGLDHQVVGFCQANWVAITL
jgi:hypothetical protein